MKRQILTLALVVFIITDSRPQQIWPAVKKEMRPWTRWWWMGSAVDDGQLDRQLGLYRDAGFGGVEITPIYGATGYESRYIDFLSPAWIDRLHFTVSKAAALGMGVDMNTGTGWPFGGPQITRDLASSRLILRANGEDLANGRALPNPEALTAVSGRTGQRVKRAAPGGEGYVMDHFDSVATDTYLARFTKAFGTSSPGVRCFFNDSYEVYGADWTPTLFDEFKRTKGYDLRLHLRELFADSISAPAVSERSAPVSSGSAPAPSPEQVARVKSDYRSVFSDLLLKNFTTRWSHWAHDRGALSRNQAHGSPGNLLDLYSAADIPECEAFFGRSRFDIPGLEPDPTDIRDQIYHDPVMFRFASSSAHFYGKPLVSSETFVWLTEHFRTSLAECKPEVEQLFLSGINHVFFHGTTYSPQDIPWPGWIFYASTEFVPNNSFWPHLRGLNDYITRCQSVLQAGRADHQLEVYWPVYDIWSDPKGMAKQLSMHNVEEWLYPTPFHDLATRLLRAGYSTDFVSDKMIAESAASSIILIPRCRFMPLATLQHLLHLANTGSTIIFAALPGDVPGLANYRDNHQRFLQLLASLHFRKGPDSVAVAKTGSGSLLLGPARQALAHTSALREQLPDLGLQYIRRDLPDGKYYYIVNHTRNTIDTAVVLNVTPGRALLMDPLDGRSGLADTTGTAALSATTRSSPGARTAVTPAPRLKIRLQLLPGEAMIVRTFLPRALDGSTARWTYLDRPGTPEPLAGPWALQFISGGPKIPSSLRLDSLSCWTSLPDSSAVTFSGTGAYTTTFNCKDLSAGEYVLEAKGLHESARIWINDKDAGFLWCYPFRLRIKQYLHTGSNTIRIEVANLMANRIRDMDRKGISWRNYHEINFVSIQYKPFDASHWQVQPSGLAGPVTITPYIIQ
ncbi:MAG TPA: glycosyl hydrolase [Puia sp.]